MVIGFVIITLIIASGRVPRSTDPVQPGAGLGRALLAGLLIAPLPVVPWLAWNLFQLRRASITLGRDAFTVVTAFGSRYTVVRPRGLFQVEDRLTVVGDEGAVRLFVRPWPGDRLFAAMAAAGLVRLDPSSPARSGATRPTGPFFADHVLLGALLVLPPFVLWVGVWVNVAFRL